MKRIAGFIIALICLAPSISARGDRYYQGFYIGASGGLANNVAKARTALNSTVPYSNPAVDFFTSNSNLRIYENIGWGEIYGGLGCQTGFDCCRPWLYLGGRLGLNFSAYEPGMTPSARLSDPTDEGDIDAITSVKGRMRHVELTADFKPGLVLTQSSFMFYSLIGIAYNRTHFKAVTRLPITVSGTVSENNLEISEHKTNIGFRGGFGFEYFLSRCVSLHGVYVYTGYTTIFQQDGVTDVSQGIVTNTNGLRSSYSFSPKKQVVSAGLAYYF